MLCDHHDKISLALEMTADLPEESGLERWYAEPVKVLIIPTRIFVMNKVCFAIRQGHYIGYYYQIYKKSTDWWTLCSLATQFSLAGIRPV